jgi:hypothetical protein
MMVENCGECWVVCPNGKKRTLDECINECEYFDGIVPKDSLAWLRNLPNCDVVCCNYDYHWNLLIPIRSRNLRDSCLYCSVRKSCSVGADLLSKS